MLQTYNPDVLSCLVNLFSDVITLLEPGLFRRVTGLEAKDFSYSSASTSSTAP